MAAGSPKAEDAFRTIGELSNETGVPQHVLRYWETRFEQLRPLQRAGNRRYYRPADAALVRRIDALLNREGYTVRGVQQVLAAGVEADADAVPAALRRQEPSSPHMIAALGTIRDRLAAALADDV